MAASWRGPSTLHNNHRKCSRSLPRYGHNRRELRLRRSRLGLRLRSISPERPPAWPVHQPASAMLATPASSLSDSHHFQPFHIPKLEHTPSGSTILFDEDPIDSYYHHTLLLEADLLAATGVVSHFDHFETTPLHVQHARNLKNLIYHCSTFDDITLSKILNAADYVFFHDTLKGRVRWEWSSAPRFHNELVGTTALRECRDPKGGVECLVVLSEPLLKGGEFHRRLGVGVFLHELIHAFLFITCGFTARAQGGHTEGFHKIAAFIDEWVGEGFLRLCNMTANLSYFRKDDGMWEEVVEDDLFSDPAFPVFRSEERSSWRSRERGLESN